MLNPIGVVVEQKSYEAPLQAILSRPAASEREVLLRDLINAVELAKDDTAINTLVLDFNQLYFVGISKAEEIAAALELFKKSGKLIVAIGDYYTQDQYLLASYADDIMLHPMGGVALEGYANYQNYFAEALDKLRVNVHVFKAGNYKSAVEPYLRNDMSEYAEEASYSWLNQLWQRYVDTIATQRAINPAALAQYIDTYDIVLGEVGGDSAEAALALGLVDSIKNRYQMNEALIEIVGSSDVDGLYKAISYDDYLTLHDRSAPRLDNRAKVGVIVARGMILDGQQPAGLIGGDSLAALINTARRDNAIGAVVLRVDSGGGSAFASEIVREQIVRLNNTDKPFVVSMGSVAASGGYWISASADQIWATPTTLTGSIGVFGLFPTLENSLASLGVHTDGIGTTKLAGATRIDQPINPVLKSAIQHSIDSTYQRFLEIVAQGRNKSLLEIDTVARGRVWTGVDALHNGLVDKLGGLNAAVAAAADLAELDDYEVEYIHLPLNPQELLLMQLARKATSFSQRGLYDTDWFASFKSLLLPISRSVQLLSGLNDPRGVYVHCVPCLAP